MNISIGQSMDRIEELLKEKAILENLIEDFNIKINSIEDKRYECKQNIVNINKKIEIEMLMVEAMKLNENGIIDDKELVNKTELLMSELEAFILRDKEGSSG